MTIKLIALPYPDDALAPTISAETLRTHHGKHHATYVKKTNEAAAKLGMESASLEEVVAAAKAKDKPAYNNAAQAWNHGFYWHSLDPSGAKPDAALTSAIKRDFGSLKALTDELAARGEKHFASGWVWLAASKGGALSVEETHDGDTLALGAKRPLLTIDLWEHAYYLDHKNERPKYLKGVIGGLLAWDFASRNYAAKEAWRYPG